MDWLTRLREDLQAARDRDPAARSSLEILLTYPGVHALLIQRLTHRLWLADRGLLARVLSHLGRFLTGVEIHPGATIGHRCFIDHGMGVVIGETAVIGDDCHLFQGVTLGGTSTRREKRHPTIEDNVVVGAGAKIIGDVTIGEGARIGAGAVVVSSVPPHATVVGVPGHVVAYTNRSNETVERLPDPEWDRLEALERRLDRLESTVRDGRAAPPQPAAHAAGTPSGAPGAGGSAS
jgi:serine O-acetyltransferase